MIPASGIAPEPAGNAFISDLFPQGPILFPPELTGKTLGTWLAAFRPKNFVPRNARFRHFSDSGIPGISKGTAWSFF